MMRLANSLTSRAAALALAGLALSCAGMIVSRAIIVPYSDLQDEGEALERRYEVTTATAARLSLAETQANELDKALRDNGFYLTDPTAELAAAKVLNTLSDMIVRHQGQMQTSQQLPRSDVEERNGLVRLSLSFAITNKGLVALLGDIDGAQPLIAVNDLIVRSDGILQGNTADRSGGPFDDDATLNVSVVVAGFMLPAEARR